MSLKGIVWTGVIASVFLLLPSLGMKIWDFIVYGPLDQKQWLFYFLAGWLLVLFARWRWQRRKMAASPAVNEDSLLLIAKERLVRGEINVAEFQAIKREIIPGEAVSLKSEG